MLLADKHDLQQKLRLNLLQIEEKELNFYTQNCYTIGTQAALLAGFAFSAMCEVEIDRTYGEHTQALWLISIVLSMTLEIGAVVKSMQLSILGPGLALRGPEGSVARAIMVMRDEYKKVNALFYAGLANIHLSVGVFIWAEYVTWAAAVLTVIILFGLGWLYRENQSVARRLRLHNDLGSWDPAAGDRLTFSFSQDDPNCRSRDMSCDDSMAGRRNLDAHGATARSTRLHTLRPRRRPHNCAPGRRLVQSTIAHRGLALISLLRAPPPLSSPTRLLPRSRRALASPRGARSGGRRRQPRQRH